MAQGRFVVHRSGLVRVIHQPQRPVPQSSSASHHRLAPSAGILPAQPFHERPAESVAVAEPRSVTGVVSATQRWRISMFKGGLLWLIGIPIPIIILLFLFGIL
jgi:hypothetical protein